MLLVKKKTDIHVSVFFFFRSKVVHRLTIGGYDIIIENEVMECLLNMKMMKK